MSTQPDWSKAPEGATHFDPIDQNFLREVDEALLIHLNGRGWCVSKGHQYGPSVAECPRMLVMRPAWSGEGLPPVGTVCEVQRSNLKWYRCEIFAIRGNEALFDLDAGHADSWDSGDASLFRPIRTPEQIAAEEREREINELTSLLKTAVRREHDIVRELAKSLIAAGYRKVEGGAA